MKDHSGGGSLRNRFLGGIAWTGLSRSATNLLSIGVTVILARLLTPQDYGLMAMVAVFTGLAQQAQEMGVGQALIQREVVTRENQQVAFTLAFCASSLMYLVLFASAGLIAWYYEDREVIPVLRVVALTFPISAFIVVPKAMLRRGLTVRGESIVAFLAMVLDASSTILLAWAGLGVWALVAGKLVSVSTNALGLAFVFPWSARLRLRGGEVRSIFRFGSGVTMSSLLWYGYSNADFLIIGRFLGVGALGAYNMAWNLAKMPWDRLWMVINPLVLPLFSRARGNPGELGRVLTRMSHYSALIIMPAVAGLGMVADDAVPLVLGEKWAAAAGPLRWLCAYGLARGVLVLLPPVLVATGRIRQEVMFNLLCFIFLPTAFVFAVRQGPSGPAAAWAVLYPLLALVWLLPKAVRAADLSFWAYVRALIRPLLATAGMVAAVLLAGEVVADQGWIRLSVRVAVGVVAYLGAVRVLEGPVTKTLFGIFGDARRGMRG